MAYSSQYYDPAKAHEYYEKHKKLKGRTSTAGLNDAGKVAAKEVKERITEEKKAQIEAIKEQAKERIAAAKEQMQGKIDALRAQLKGMSKEERQAKKEEIMNQISGLRAENKSLREKVQGDSKTLREQTKAAFDEKYAQELEKINSSSEFQKPKKSKKK